MTFCDSEEAPGDGGDLFRAPASVTEFALLRVMGPQPLAQELGARGIVGVTLSEKSHGWGSHVIEAFALGTAIVKTDSGMSLKPPMSVLDLNDR